MRQIILGSIKNNPIITHNITRAFIQAREFLHNLNIDLDIDYLFSDRPKLIGHMV